MADRGDADADRDDAAFDDAALDDADRADEGTDSPATWENVLVGRAKEVVGHALGARDLTEEGEEQVEAAHEVRAEQHPRP